MPKRKPKKPDAAFPDVVQCGVVYPLSDFQRRTGLGDYAMRQARRKGLRVRYVGGRGFVIGDDWIDWLSRQAEEDS